MVTEAAFGPFFHTLEQFMEQTFVDNGKQFRIHDVGEPVGIGALFQVCYEDDPWWKQSPPIARWRVSFVPEESTAFQAGLRCGDIIHQVEFDFNHI